MSSRKLERVNIFVNKFRSYVGKYYNEVKNSSFRDSLNNLSYLSEYRDFINMYMLRFDYGKDTAIFVSVSFIRFERHVEYRIKEELCEVKGDCTMVRVLETMENQFGLYSQVVNYLENRYIKQVWKKELKELVC